VQTEFDETLADTVYLTFLQTIPINAKRNTLCTLRRMIDKLANEVISASFLARVRIVFSSCRENFEFESWREATSSAAHKTTQKHFPDATHGADEAFEWFTRSGCIAYNLVI